MKTPTLKLSHISLTARDADTLSSFYRDFLDFADRRPPRRLRGERVSRGNGLPNSDIYLIWLDQHDQQGPFLEIVEYIEDMERRWPEVNELGYAHLAFEVRDLQATIEKVLRSGGACKAK